jgi:hypothetical protein
VQAGIQHRGERDEVCQEALTDAFAYQLALAPGERHGGGDIQAEGGEASQLVEFGEVQMLQQPWPAVGLQRPAPECLKLVQVGVVLGEPGGHDIEAQTALGAEADRLRGLLDTDERPVVFSP